MVYDGFDADWEGGLSAAQAKFSDHETWKFHKATAPADLSGLEARSRNVAASLETLEHVPPETVAPYLAELSRIVDGYILITAPNEKGLVFLSKWLIKKLFLGGTQPYTASEVIAATLGRMDKVARDDHKGFDYDALVAQISEHFDVVRVEGAPFRWLPASFSATICILAKSKAGAQRSG